jgi:hypothetical protein
MIAYIGEKSDAKFDWLWGLDSLQEWSSVDPAVFANEERWSSACCVVWDYNQMPEG